MNEGPCSHCQSAKGYVFRRGDILAGEYGSARYDTTRLAITDAEALEDISVLCDDCVGEMEDQGKVHAYMAFIGDVEDRCLPAKAYEVIFLDYARSITRTIGRKRAPQLLKGEPASMELVETLRSELEYDPSQATSFRTGQRMFAEETLRVAKAHVLAALALGVEPDDNHLEKAAVLYAERLEKKVAAIEEMLSALHAEFAALS